MKKWVSSLIAGISLVMFIAICLLWVTSHSRMDEVSWNTKLDGWAPVPVRRIFIRFARGCVEVGTLTEQRFEYRDWWPRKLGHDVGYPPIHPQARVVESGWRRKYGGFGAMQDWPLERSPFGRPIPYVSIASVWAPSWFVVLITALLPVRRLFLWLRFRRRIARGLCARCGYDLRAGGERCSECGLAVELALS